MRVIAEGKEAVLTYLEDQLVGMPGHPGRYMLAEDDSGLLVICIAGCTFIGEGDAKLDGNKLTVRRGIVLLCEIIKTFGIHQLGRIQPWYVAICSLSGRLLSVIISMILLNNRFSWTKRTFWTKEYIPSRLLL